MSEQQTFADLCAHVDEVRQQAFQHNSKIGAVFYELQDRRFYNEWKRDPELKTISKTLRANITDPTLKMLAAKVRKLEDTT